VEPQPLKVGDPEQATHMDVRNNLRTRPAAVRFRPMEITVRNGAKKLLKLTQSRRRLIGRVRQDCRVHDASVHWLLLVIEEDWIFVYKDTLEQIVCQEACLVSFMALTEVRTVVYYGHCGFMYAKIQYTRMR
jgi:hypothetical protein